MAQVRGLGPRIGGPSGAVLHSSREPVVRLHGQVYTPCPGKKRPQYSRHNFDEFSHSFVIFGTNHPDTSMY